MLVLAIDTALDACSAALIDADDDRVLASESREIGRGHAEHLLPIIDGVMKKAGVKFNDVDRFAVTVGPGSFTGLRVGLSAARGFGLVTKKPVVLSFAWLVSAPSSSATRDSMSRIGRSASLVW